MRLDRREDGKYNLDRKPSVRRVQFLVDRYRTNRCDRVCQRRVTPTDKGDALESYRITFGKPNDTTFTEGIYQRESTPEYTFRWSHADSALKLPVPENREVQVDLAVTIPEEALAENPEKAGIYLGEEKVASFTEPGAKTYSVRLPPQAGGSVRLEARVDGWDPPGNDTRRLGFQYRFVRVSAPGNQEERFDVNQQKGLRLSVMFVSVKYSCVRFRGGGTIR